VSPDETESPRFSSKRLGETIGILRAPQMRALRERMLPSLGEILPSPNGSSILLASRRASCAKSLQRQELTSGSARFLTFALTPAADDDVLLATGNAVFVLSPHRTDFPTQDMGNHSESPGVGRFALLPKTGISPIVAALDR
jgi:hypothetical protein